MARLRSRLGAPSSSGFKVWYQSDKTSATVTIEVRVIGAAFALADTQTVDGTKADTAVLTVTGLLPATEYEYRLLEDAVEQTKNITWTMPTSGRYFVYALSDLHGALDRQAFARALTHFEAVVEPLNIPAFVLYFGDLFQIQGPSNKTLATAGNALGLVLDDADVAPVMQRLPFVYMFDDWDWGGDNSHANANRFAVAADAATFQDYYWRDRPSDASPSFGFHHVIADVPFIMLDGRSQKETNTTTLQGVPSFTVNNTYPDDVNATMLGQVQRDWAIARLQEHNEKGAVFLITCTTFKDRLGRATFNDLDIGVGSRDGWGGYYIGERNHILTEGCVNYGYAARNNLIVLSGDDHYNVVWDWTPCLDITTLGLAPGGPAAVSGPMPPLPGNLKFREFKTRCIAEQLLANEAEKYGGTDGNFGVAWVQDTAAALGGLIIFDITSLNQGKNVSVRALYIDRDTGDPLKNAAGTDGDFYLQNGNWSAFDGSTTGSGTQTYPPENGQGPIQFRRSFLDDVYGTLDKEHLLMRDFDGRLVHVDRVDEASRDKLLETHEPPVEAPLEPIE
ncbi:MAG: alkaline phosphatase D family protein [Acidimicrobiia bacterium]